MPSRRAPKTKKTKTRLKRRQIGVTDDQRRRATHPTDPKDPTDVSLNMPVPSMPTLPTV